jgi:hypothetical protein
MSTFDAWAAGLLDAGLSYRISVGKDGGLAIQARVRILSIRARRALAEGYGLKEAAPYVLIPAKRQAAVFGAALPYSQRAAELNLLIGAKEAVRGLRKNPAARKALTGLLLGYRKIS